MASTIKVNTLDTQTGTELALAATKKITGDNTQFKITGGLSGDVLTTNGSGLLSFGGMAGFAGVHADITSGSSVYTVPTGVTKLVVYITGGGGGGGGGVTVTQEGTGGTGATTVIARVTVVAADTITIAVGAGGTAGGAGGHGGDGGDSTFTHTTGSGTFDTITAPGGTKGTYMAATAVPAAPVAGTVGASNEGISVIGSRGMGPGGQRTGGPTFWGGGELGAVSPYMVAKAGVCFGTGGGGGQSVASYNNGALGADGVCLIFEHK